MAGSVNQKGHKFHVPQIVFKNKFFQNHFFSNPSFWNNFFSKIIFISNLHCRANILGDRTIAGIWWPVFFFRGSRDIRRKTAGIQKYLYYFWIPAVLYRGYIGIFTFFITGVYNCRVSQTNKNFTIF